MEAHGTMPDTAVAQHAGTTFGQRATQLAKDTDDVDNVMGMADIVARYLRRLTFIQEKNGTGEKHAIVGIALIPVEESLGDALTKLEEIADVVQRGFCECVGSTYFPTPRQGHINLSRAGNGGSLYF